MLNKQNLHTHSTFCDGADNLEEMIQEAIDKGFDSLGFSGHSYARFSPMFANKEDKTPLYKKTVLQLKEKYKNEI